MVSLLALWLPIVVAAILVFLASSVLHMVLPFHRSDYSRLPDEDAVREAMRTSPPTPGIYPIPYCTDPKEATSEAMIEKYRQGPVAMIHVVANGPIAMGRTLGQWFAFCLLVSVFAAYLGGRTLASGVDYLTVFRVTSTAAFMSYGLGGIVDSIWRAVPWRVTAKGVIDGLVYALLTGGAFGWLWPS